MNNFRNQNSNWCRFENMSGMMIYIIVFYIHILTPLRILFIILKIILLRERFLALQPFSAKEQKEKKEAVVWEKKEV